MHILIQPEDEDLRLIDSIHSAKVRRRELKWMISTWCFFAIALMLAGT